MIEKYGQWTGPGVFEFFEPREIGPGMVMKEIDVSQFFTAEPDVTAEMIVEALINGRVVTEQSEVAMVPVTCPDCGRKGEVPAEAVGGTSFLRCPECRDKGRN